MGPRPDPHGRYGEEYRTFTVRDPYRMDDADRRAELARLRKLTYAESDDYIDVFWKTPKLWLTAFPVLAISLTWLFLAPTLLSFLAPALPVWAAWWVLWFHHNVRANRAEVSIRDLNDAENAHHSSYGEHVGRLASVADYLRALPRDLRETHRGLWDSATAAYEVLRLESNDRAWDILVDAEGKAEELLRAHKTMAAAVAADELALKLNAAVSSLPASTIAAHEAAHEDAQALMAGAESMRAMTAQLNQRAESLKELS